MNIVHDMGGMHGFGPVVAEPNEPVWHAPWEARMYALARASMIPGLRQQIERMPAADYLRASYYEKWLYALVESAIQLGLITREEAATGKTDPSSPKATPSLTADQVEAVMQRGRLSTRDVERQPVFRLGDTVRTRNIHPTTHTRLPRFARDKPGVIVMLHGAHVFPDTNAQSQGENPQPLYTVDFRARDLWGEAANPRDTVRIDLWEDYLAPAG
jgi:nitrile hydratase beta subunit